MRKGVLSYILYTIIKWRPVQFPNPKNCVYTQWDRCYLSKCRNFWWKLPYTEIRNIISCCESRKSDYNICISYCIVKLCVYSTLYILNKILTKFIFCSIMKYINNVSSKTSKKISKVIWNIHWKKNYIPTVFLPYPYNVFEIIWDTLYISPLYSSYIYITIHNY